MRYRPLLTGGVLAVAVVAGVLWEQLPVLGAGGLLHPAKRVASAAPPPGCVEQDFAGAGVTLRGWACGVNPPPRGTVVYLHGIADNRGSAAGVIPRFLALGFNVVAYDSRAHGESGGTACTYGFFEKEDLLRVVDTLPRKRIILVGTSLGAAVALQEAAIDPRISDIVAVETFSDLRTVARARAPRFFTGSRIDRAFQRAEADGQFSVEDVSPVRAAAQIIAPTLLIHGAADTDTPPSHSQRVFDALRGPKELVLVPGARHNQSLNGETWRRVEQWIGSRIPISDSGSPTTVTRTPASETQISPRSSR